MSTMDHFTALSLLKYSIVTHYFILIKNLFETSYLIIIRSRSDECPSPYSILNCVHYGMGVSLLPESYIREYISSGYISMCSVVNDEMKRKFFLVQEKKKHSNASTMKVLAHIYRTFSSVE